MNNDEKLRNEMTSEPVPESLKPENIKKMLDEKAPKKKRNGIKIASRVTAAAAACAVIGGTAVYSLNNGKINRNKDASPITEKPANTSDEKTVSTTEAVTKQASYMSSASDYEQVYTMFRKAYKKAEKEQRKNDTRYTLGMVEEADIADEAEFNDAEFSTTPAGEYSDAIGGSGIKEPPVPVISSSDGDTQEQKEADEPNTEETQENEETPEHSETYYQEQDVLEADIVKTDGKHIYSVYTAFTKDGTFSNVLRVANVKDGKFTGSFSFDFTGICGEDTDILSVEDMYIYNDMIAVIGCERKPSYIQASTFVAFFTTGDEPQLIDVYQQDGYYHDVRISPDGYMLLLSDYTSSQFSEIEDCNDVTKYVPCYGFNDSSANVAPEDILLPDGDFDSQFSLNYSVIGSIDLNESGVPTSYDIKTLAGYSGSIYCSADNLYTASPNYEMAENNTDITRISINGGDIVPMAGGTIKGYVKDQFSMSEYGGYFRVAATYSEVKSTFHPFENDGGFIGDIWGIIQGDDNGYYSYETVKTDSRVYVLDMDMNMVGSVDGLGINEQIKSASFSGDMAYIVTFRQTDPLYAVDLSEPSEPVVLDEFKINGFSTYMQSWGDGLLLGFGQDADNNGRLTGIRMTMFDNSDPDNLKAADEYTWNNIYASDFAEYEKIIGETDTWYSSAATWDRKALLIAPEKNLIGVPVTKETYTYGEDYSGTSTFTTQYQFFSFEDGKFVPKGEITETTENADYDYGRNTPFIRSLYIGDNVYVLSANKFVSADIDNIEITDELNF